MEDKPIEQKESIKLTKNAKGDYQWEIKVIAEEGLSNILNDDDIKRLKKLNDDLEKRFGKK